MTNIPLAKPTSVGEAIISAGPIGLIGGVVKFHLKVRRFRPRYNVRKVETTGDGDKMPFFEHSGHLYMNFTMQGWMLSEIALGLKNLIVADENPLKTNVVFRLSAERSLEFGALLETIMADWDRVAPWVGVAIVGEMHNTDPALLSGFEL